MADRQEHDANLRAAERAHDQANEAFHRLNEAAMRDAQATIRIVLVINGGAAIAVLALVGSLISKGSYSLPQLTGIVVNSLWFVFGVMATAFAAAFAYLTNLCYAGSLSSRTRTWDHPYFQQTRASMWYLQGGRIFHLLGFLAAVAGIILFIVGMLKTSSSVHLLH